MSLNYNFQQKQILNHPLSINNKEIEIENEIKNLLKGYICLYKVEKPKMCKY